MKRFGAFLSLLVLAACQSNPSPPTNPANPGAPSLTLTPPSINVSAGDAPVTFVATVQNSSEAVTWVYSGAGSITPTSGPATSYTPPASVEGVQSESLIAVLGTTGVRVTAPIAVYPAEETPPSEPPPAPPPTEPNPPTDPTDASDPTDPTPPDPTDPTTPDPTNPTTPDPTTYTLTVAPPTNGKITAADDGDGIDCGKGATDCTAVYGEGSTALLTAIPDEGRTVESWGGDCSGNVGVAECTLTMDANKSASVTILPYYLTINVQSGYGIVNVQSSAGGLIFQCYPGDSPCKREIYVEPAVTLTAPSGTYAQFQGWQGACSGAGACSLTMDRDYEVTAIFLDTPPQ